MKNSIISNFEKKKFPLESGLPTFRPGDTVRVHYKIQEGSEAGKFRIQPFEGVVIAFKRGGPESTFTVRKIGANSQRVFCFGVGKVEGPCEARPTRLWPGERRRTVRGSPHQVVGWGGQGGEPRTRRDSA